MNLNKSSEHNLHLALVHYPVINKNGEIITSAVTNLDLHDIARVAKTYGIKSYFVITPLEDQKRLAQKIIEHWTHGAGGIYNSKRREALELIHIEDTFDKVIQSIQEQTGNWPKVVATSAKNRRDCIGFNKMRDMVKSGHPYLITLGTAWGLSKQMMSNADYVLKPIKGFSDYNHLSVRSAAAIILDRLTG